MWFLVDSPAKRFLVQQEVEILKRKIYGTKCIGLLERYNLELFLLKMYPNRQYRLRQKIFPKLDILQTISICLLPTWVQIIFGKEFGYFHTPTVIANFAAPSMQKHKCCRNFKMVFGKPSPTNYEMLMGWPIGWTNCGPLETDRFRLWRQSHFLKGIEE